MRVLNAGRVELVSRDLWPATMISAHVQESVYFLDAARLDSVASRLIAASITVRTFAGLLDVCRPTLRRRICRRLHKEVELI